MAIKDIRKRLKSYLYNHRKLKGFLDYGWAFVVTLASAAIFAFGINVLLSPSIEEPGGGPIVTLVSGGVSGLAQCVVLIGQIIVGGHPLDGTLKGIIYGACYFLFNVPLVIVAFKGIGVRFGIFTLLNVALVGLFSYLFQGVFFDNLARFISDHGGLISRAVFAGFCTGISSAMAYKIETSAGGFDVIAYYISLRKSGGAGAYGSLINLVAVVLFGLLSPAAGNVVTAVGIDPWSSAMGGLFFSALYLLVTALIIDAINVRNKKVQLQIITDKEELVGVLLSRVPHGATIIRGKGAFTGKDRYVIYMVISSLELNYVIEVIREADPASFVNVTALRQVYGHFFTRPIR